MVLLVGLSAVGAGMVGCGGKSAAPPRPGPGCAHIDPSVTCSVLFLGNSYTAVNDLPTVFRKLATSGGFAVSTKATDPGGTTLQEHLDDPEMSATLTGSTWNVVVMQDQSEIPSVESLRQGEMYPAVRALVSGIREARAEPLLFETWAHSQGWPENGLLTYDQMQAAINQGYLSIGKELDVATAPVGSAWSLALGERMGALLWSDDGSHPTTMGTYLAACVFYATIFGRSPRGLSYHADLSAAEAAQLQRIASQAA